MDAKQSNLIVPPGRAQSRWPQNGRAALRAGFSLIELMIVVAIVGILAGVAVPKMTNAVRRNRIQAQVEHLQNDIVSMRNLARNTMRCVDITLSAGGQGIHAKSYEPGSNLDCSTMGTAAGIDRDFIYTNGGNNKKYLHITLPGMLRFNTEGRLVGGSNLQVNVSAENAHHVLNVWWVTGAVRIDR